MPKTLTLTNVPDPAYDRLKTAAAAHRRSLNSEAIACLALALLPRRMDASERLARARALRAGLPNDAFTEHDIDAFKREGRQ